MGKLPTHPPLGSPAADRPTHHPPPPPSRPIKFFAPSWGLEFQQAAPLDGLFGWVQLGMGGRCLTADSCHGALPPSMPRGYWLPEEGLVSMPAVTKRLQGACGRRGAGAAEWTGRSREECIC